MFARTQWHKNRDRHCGQGREHAGDRDRIKGMPQYRDKVTQGNRIVGKQQDRDRDTVRGG